MAWVYYLLLIATDFIGLALAVYTLPGLWVMLGGAALYAALTHGAYAGGKTLVALLVLTVVAEIAEFFFGGAGAKKAGGSGWGVLGGIVGAILGGIFFSIPFPVVGTIAGICLGAGAGAAAMELVFGKPVGQSLRIGLGAAKGRLVGILGKFLVGVVMIGITVVAAFPAGGSSRAAGRPATHAATVPSTRAR